MTQNPEWEPFSLGDEGDLEKWGIDSEELAAELEPFDWEELEPFTEEDWQALKFDEEEPEQFKGEDSG